MFLIDESWMSSIEMGILPEVLGAKFSLRFACVI